MTPTIQESSVAFFLSPLPFRGKLLLQGRSSHCCIVSLVLSFGMYATNFKEKAFFAEMSAVTANSIATSVIVRVCLHTSSAFAYADVAEYSLPLSVASGASGFKTILCGAESHA